MSVPSPGITDVHRRAVALWAADRVAPGALS